MKIYELNRDQRFTAPAIKQFGIMKFRQMDGMYAQVNAEDEEINKRECERYSAGCSFFCLHLGLEVEPVD